MYTLTLPNPRHNSTSTEHTYCVGVGAGALDHTTVIDWFAQEVEELMKGRDYYCADMKKIIHVCFGVVAILTDRPEKAFNLKTSLLGDYGRIASWAACIVPDILVDCKLCFNERLKCILDNHHSAIHLRSCSKCCQWNLRSTSSSRKNVSVPKYYPTTCDENSPVAPTGRQANVKYLIPIQQTFEWLITAIFFASHNVSVGAWKRCVIDAYLRSCAVSTSVRNNIWQECKPQRASAAQEESADDIDNDTDDDEVDDGISLVVMAPERMEGTYIPKIWTSKLKMSAYIDCGMHLVFHGIVAYCVERIEEFMKCHKVTQDFNALVNIYLTDIADHRLDWCKLKCFPKKQWLAENEVGLARILPFVYGLFFRNINLPESSFTSKASEVAIMQMFQSIHVLISNLMSPRNVAAPQIDGHIKLFLSCCHRYCRVYFAHDVKPFWANTGNFPTLLNLAEQRARFGPIRWYWEGTNERFIGELKKYLVSMRKTPQYFMGKLSLMFKTNVMDKLKESMERYINGDEDEIKQRTPNMYYQYKDLEEVRRRVREGKVLSGFSFDNNDCRIMIAYGNKRRSGVMSCVSISRLNPGHLLKSIGLAYVQCRLDEASSLLLDVNVEVVENAIANYCLLLPFINKAEFTDKYAVIYDDWDAGDEDFKKILPIVCSILFGTDVMRTN